MDIDNSAIIKSTDYCQDIIKRMASNSFKLKAWFLVTFSALFTYFANAEQKNIADLIWVAPTLMFVVLDSYYLKQERIFREVYNDFRDIYNGKGNTRQPFNMTPTKKQLKAYTIANCIFSISVGWFYFPLLVAFQGLVIYYTTYKILMVICPIVLIALSFILRKKTEHAKGE